MELTAKQKKQLKGLAHSLKPAARIGKAGISEGLVSEIDRALSDHELIKVKIGADDKAGFQGMASDLSSQTSASLVHTIGRTAILYRETSREGREKIKLAD